MSPLVRWNRSRTAALTSLALLTAMCSPTLARATATLGFVEHWPGTSLSGWSGGSSFTNPGTGGAVDNGGYLVVRRTLNGNLGTKSNGEEYAGNWTAAGITQVRVWCNDVGADQPLEIHFGVGRDNTHLSPNFWQYDVGLIPPLGTWAEFIVPLALPGWTQTHGSGTFANALQDVDVVHFRHDLAPYQSFPDPIVGDFGIDRLLLTNGVVGVGPPASGSGGGPVELAPPYPNPSRGPVALQIRASGGMPVRVQVLDVAGRVIREGVVESPSEHRVWIWDGSDERGRRAPAGSYRVRAWGAVGGTSRALVRIP